jgi:hypothetical protein
MENTDEKLYRTARKKVRRKRKFYSHLLSYLAVGLFLTFVNWFTRPGHWWVQWVWIGWGIGIFFHAISLYRRNILFGDDWEEQKIKEEMEKIKKR